MIPAQLMSTILVDDIPGLEGTAVSPWCVRPHALPLAVERTMRWDATGYGAHTREGGPGRAR